MGEGRGNRRTRSGQGSRAGRRGPRIVLGDSNVVHLAVVITDADQLAVLLSQGVLFRDCTFDGADVTDVYAEEMVFESCSLKQADFSNLACQSLQVTDSNLERANFEKADV